MTPIESASTPVRIAIFIFLGLFGVALFFLVSSIVVRLGLKVGIADGLHPFALVEYYQTYGDDPRIMRWIKIGAFAGALPILALAGAVVFRLGIRPLHGAASWANEGQVKRDGLRAERGIILGRKGGRYLMVDGSDHVIVYAPTGAGKGVSLAIPNMLNWADSLVCLDIKNEGFLKSAGFRAAHGHQVFLLDPTNEEGRTARYNPLAYINREDPTAVVVELQKIASMIIDVPEKGDTFFALAGRTGFVAVGGMVAETPSLPFSIGEIYRALTSSTPKDLIELVEKRRKEGRPFSVATHAAVMDFAKSAENTFQSVRQTITASLGLWLNPRVDKATEASDFDLRDIRRTRMSIYLGAPPSEMIVLRPLYNLFFQQLIDLNTRVLPENDPEAKYQVLVLLDEFKRIGRATVLAEAFSYVRGYGIRLMPVIQTPAQLEDVYGPATKREIMTNCGTEVIFTPKDEQDARELSERLGYQTVKSTSRSAPRGLGQGNRSSTESDQRRALMLPQELRKFPKDQLIIIRAGIDPIRAKKIYYYSDKDFTARLLPAPEVRSIFATDPRKLSADVEGLASTVQSLRAEVEELKQTVLVRPMSEAEAASTAPLPAGAVSMNYEDIGLEMPASDSSDDAVERWIMTFVDKKAVAAEPAVS